MLSVVSGKVSSSFEVAETWQSGLLATARFIGYLSMAIFLWFGKTKCQRNLVIKWHTAHAMRAGISLRLLIVFFASLNNFCLSIETVSHLLCNDMIDSIVSIFFPAWDPDLKQMLSCIKAGFAGLVLYFAWCVHPCLIKKQMSRVVKGKGKGAYSSSWNSPQNYGTPLVNGTCHPTEVTARLHPSRGGWYSIYRPRKDERLSWPSWLVTYQNGLPIHRRSPIRVLTGSDVAQLRWLKPTR